MADKAKRIDIVQAPTVAGAATPKAATNQGTTDVTKRTGKINPTIGTGTNVGTGASKAPTYKAPGAYQSQYQSQMDTALDKITNRQAFTYDPLKDANYQAMAKVYQQQGNKAAQTTMADAAALNGGYGTSYAQAAAQQVRNDYNAQLASHIPEFENMAYQRYADDYNMNIAAYNALGAADDRAYGIYRDNVGDSQWKYGVDRSVYESDRDYNRGVYESDRNFKFESDKFDWTKKTDERDFNWNKSTWQKEYDWNKSTWQKEFDLKKKNKSGSVGGKSSGNYIGNNNSNNTKNDDYKTVTELRDKTLGMVDWFLKK